MALQKSEGASINFQGLRGDVMAVHVGRELALPAQHLHTLASHRARTCFQGQARHSFLSVAATTRQTTTCDQRLVSRVGPAPVKESRHLPTYRRSGCPPSWRGATLGA